MTGALRRSLDYAALVLILAGLVLLFSLLSERFLTVATFSGIANRIPTLAVLATGMTLVLIIGAIDLSVGSVLALAGSVIGLLLVDWQWPLWSGILAALFVGLLAGAVNGGVVVGFRVPSFIVTLGMLEMARGGAYLATDSQTKYLGGAAEGLARPIGGWLISPAFVLAVGVVLAGHVLLTRTVFGRKMIAVGTNESATRLAGIDPRPIKLIVFALAGLLSAVAAVCHLARLGASDPNAGGGMELAAIAAAVIGGTSLSGGRGSVLCTFLGVLIIATLETGLAQVGATEPMKRLITGAVIVLAVVTDGLRKRSWSTP
jgi:ribose transport system permease protein